jgi:DNA-binding IclR family transcriptional regulator
MTTPPEAPGVPRRRGAGPEPVGAYPVMRTVRALERLAFQPLSAPELATSLQSDHRTVRRLLRRLAVEDYVTQSGGPRRHYQLTHRLAALGRQAIAHAPLPRAAAPRVATLAAQTGHPAGLWIPCYADVVCVLHTTPHGPAPGPTLGALAPAHASAPGKALLAHRAAWRDSVLARSLEHHTPRTLTDPRDLRAELDRTRARGHATDTGEHHPDERAIAATVFLADDPIAAIAITLTANEPATIDLDALAAHTTRAAAALSRTLSHHH